MLIKIILEKKCTLSKLREDIKIYPQVLINAKVSESKKYDYDKDEEIKKEIEKLQEEFAGNRKSFD